MPSDLPVDCNQTTLAQATDHRIRLYSVAAAAAGVSMLALALPAQAEVVVTQTHLPLLAQTPVSLDFNKDGISDFTFELYIYGDFGLVTGDLTVQPLPGGGIIAQPVGNFAYASALVRGAKIGPSAHFSAGRSVRVERSEGTHTGGPSYSRHLYGKWGNSTNRYLGIKFSIHGATHFGWVRFAINSTKWPMSTSITGYAYETVANKPVVAGTPPKAAAHTQSMQESGWPRRPSLGMLATGADGLAIWRREERPVS